MVSPHDAVPAAQAVYAISVAAELAGIGVQTLRLYEQHGLLTPARSAGGTRRYSGDDLTRLRRITTLTEEGVNLAAVARILELEDTVARLRAERDQLRDRRK
ncbi:MerR family transcriptional regulator [Nocardia asteroides]|uniref:MerR family transcriptional regulator n=1 Tax=Nocardia asteroides NBRC 15531 TaxID=1110697 RepID=U5EAQ3_NOCAS|nr:MerR family transcriptional regulator [Nocardia asteroides]TLF66731.1 MerR family transcriptional regulator [Nocardia asteroides NBRC 15531]UGT46158.1 MerR family transcriptional regulator [Nocardia asteroides]SFM99427.1 DNA-binding transcriptional regulator, MerR family [Nocardia asteroides]VEG35046.1 HTH-type transcriptional regulator glnR [Nocardia asteroides]GAD82229.1 putative MerR family transcriptional regulator [Nocardia asteroides NBRC 15531]